jgi:uridine kinase
MQRQPFVASLASRIVSLTRAHPTRVAIDGVDAAGKTTLADELATSIEAMGRPILRASIDGFHHPAAKRRRRGPLSPIGYFEDSFNYTALLDGLLRPLGPGGSREVKRAVFDFRTDTDVDARAQLAAPDAILLFDGVFLLRRELREYFDFSIFVRADFSVTIARAEQRDVMLFGSVDEVRKRYRERYVPGQQLYLTTCEPEQWASVVIDNNNPLQPRLIKG